MHILDDLSWRGGNIIVDLASFAYFIMQNSFKKLKFNDLFKTKNKNS